MVEHRYLIRLLPVFVVVASVVSIVLILGHNAINSFQEWVYVGAFTCMFVQLILYAMFVAILRTAKRQRKSTYIGAFRLGGFPWLAWIVYLVVRATTSYPDRPNISQSLAFFLMCLSVSLLASWWRLSSVVLKPFLSSQIRPRHR
jgi:hypothetical protein